MTPTGPVVVPVALGDRSYEVRIGELGPEAIADAIASAVGKTSGVALLVDERVERASPLVMPLAAALASRLPNVHRFALAGGEACKTLTQIERTAEWMASRGLDRGATVVGVGGGAATDHAGFAAAVYLRGVRFALVPTTLLAMVDASVGGKTAVDLAAGKNLVGAFHQPRAVVADLGFLDTLPKREIAAGFAEIVKAGLIADADLFDRLERGAAESRAHVADAITAAVRVKAAVVSEDEREGGRRAILNFGHTLGHALESESNFELLHGEAVALGMMAALALGVARGVTEPGLLARTRRLLERLGLPTDVERRITPAVLARIEVDKKRRSDGVRFVFVPRAGEAVLEDVALSQLKAQVTAALQAS